MKFSVLVLKILMPTKELKITVFFLLIYFLCLFFNWVILIFFFSKQWAEKGERVLIIAFASANISDLIATRLYRNRNSFAGIAAVELNCWPRC